MKFGKRMRGLMSREWEHDYINYKQLKQQIKAWQEEHKNTPTQQQPQWSNQLLSKFHTLLLQEMHKINVAHARILKEIESEDLRALKNALGKRWVLPPAKARTLLLGALEISYKMDAFRRFVVLNSLAVVKIAKKFDKFAGTELKQQMILEDLKTQSFYDGVALDRVCAETAALTDRIMLCVLPDGNFRIDNSSVTCPICLCGEVKTPITLSCAHTFCWSCLFKAAELGFLSCPMCRKVQSIDPRDYEIDGLIMRFKRAYSFVEKGLDRTPMVSSPMRQIVGEAFEVVNGYLEEVEAQYASISPRTSPEFSAEEILKTTTATACHTMNPESSVITTQIKQKDAVLPTVMTIFAKGDPVEVAYNGHWYPGMVMQFNDDTETYSVLWWVKGNSQRFGQKISRDQLREPIFDSRVGGNSYALYDYAAGAWRTATEWAWEPFRRLRSLSEQSTTDNNSTM